ncbi:MAG: hypothetical protein R3B48_11130 [Kofleriaceae bacterium]
MSAACDDLERAGLGDLLDEPPELQAHLASCERCRASRERYARLGAALAQLGEGAARRGDHVARVLATIDAVTPHAVTPRRWPRRVARVAAPLFALAAMAALVWWWRGGAGVPAPARFTMTMIAQSAKTLRGDAQLGERLEVSARAGTALWVYRNQHELLLVCPRDCRDDGRESVYGTVQLDQVGTYQVVWVSSANATTPTGDLEADVAAARAAGALHELRELDIQ